MKRNLIFVMLLGALLGLKPARGANAAVALVESRNHIDITIRGRPFTTYYFDPAIAKPYFQPLRSAQGTVVTRSFPMGNTIPPNRRHDPSLEPHQRPMYFAHGDVDGMDFWGEAVFSHYSDDSAFGRTVFRKILEIKGGPDSGTLRADFDLTSPRGRAVAEETQAYTFRGDDQSRTIDCEIVLLADRGADVTMGDTKEGTFAIRLAKVLNSPPAYMVNSKGAVGEKGVWGKRADWVDYDGTVAGESLGVAIFDSPRSFRHPTYWHARGYGLFAANPFGIREFTRDPNQDGSYTIDQGKSIRFIYRVLIHHGDYKQAKVAEAYQRYASAQ